MSQLNSPPLDLDRMKGYTLGASFLVWLVTGSATPLLVSLVAIAALKRVLARLD